MTLHIQKFEVLLFEIIHGCHGFQTEKHQNDFINCVKKDIFAHSAKKKNTFSVLFLIKCMKVSFLVNVFC